MRPSGLFPGAYVTFFGRFAHLGALCATTRKISVHAFTFHRLPPLCSLINLWVLRFSALSVTHYSHVSKTCWQFFPEFYHHVECLLNFGQNQLTLDRDSLNRSKELIEAAHSIVITSHRSPDGDAIGSSLALHHFLKAIGKDSTVIVPNTYADFLKWMPGNDGIRIYEEAPESCDATIAQADLIFSLDYNALHRTGEMKGRVGQCLGGFHF